MSGDKAEKEYENSLYPQLASRSLDKSPSTLRKIGKK